MGITLKLKGFFNVFILGGGLMARQLVSHAAKAPAQGLIQVHLAEALYRAEPHAQENRKLKEKIWRDREAAQLPRPARLHKAPK